MLVQVVNDGTTSVYNLEGAISFSAQGSTVAIPVGSGSTAKPGQTPSAPVPGLPASRNFRARRQLPRRSAAADRSVAEYRRQVLRGLPGRQLDGDYKNSPMSGRAVIPRTSTRRSQPV